MPATAEKTCSVQDCGKPTKARGWCNAHYLRWLRHDDPIGGGTGTGEPMSYFNEAVLAHDGAECLTWPYGKSRDGYGKVRHGGKDLIVSRMVCEAVNGPPPTPRHEAAHTCGNGNLGCCSPRHLEWKTRSENQADRTAHGTSNRGERNAGAKLTGEQAQEIRALRGAQTQKSLSDRFGVSPKTISDIHAGRRWSWL